MQSRAAARVSKNATEGRDFGNSGKDTVKIDTPALSITISHKTTLELVHTPIWFALDSKYHMTPHDSSSSGNIAETVKVKGTDFH